MLFVNKKYKLLQTLAFILATRFHFLDSELVDSDKNSTLHIRDQGLGWLSNLQRGAEVEISAPNRRYKYALMW